MPQRFKCAIAIAITYCLVTCVSATAQDVPESALTDNRLKHEALNGRDYFKYICAWIFYKYQHRGFIPQGWKDLEKGYVGEVYDNGTATGALQKMFAALNDSELEICANEELPGKTGIELENKGNARFVVRVVAKDSPAARCGVRPGDEIDQLATFSCSHETLSNINCALSGAAGSELELSLLRGGNPIKLKLIRDDKDPEAMSYCTMLSGNIAYVKPGLPLVPASKLEFFKKALSELSNTQAKGLIVDLRNNLSDYEDPCALCGCFVGTKQSFGLQFRMHTEYMNGVGTQLTKLPIIALINSTSSTSAEVLAACLKTNKRAVLLGTTTSGKGRIIPTVNVDRYKRMRIPTSEYVTCEGQFIEGNGIKPDIEVPVSAQDVFAGPWWNCSIGGKPPNILDGKDVQLKRALAEMPSVIGRSK